MEVTNRTMLRRIAFSILAFAPLTAVSMAQPAKDARPAPNFAGTTIPVPPRQNVAWQPSPTALPDILVSASALLFDQGLADPRGCDYRVIEIGAGHVWSGSASVVKTHGWVLPETSGENTRFAIAWSGLVYPVLSIGDPADIATDVQTIAAQARADRDARAKHPSTGQSGFPGSRATDESWTISATSLHPLKVCLLLRLGRSDLAEMVWAAGIAGPETSRRASGNMNDPLTSHGISYLSLANDFAWYRFDRAISAHMHGDDALALVDARALTQFEKAVEAKAAALGFERPQRPSRRPEAPRPYIDFLDQLPQLLADHERRAREPKRPSVPPPGSDPKKRVAALIDELDQVAARQFGQPGGVSLGSSPIVKDLVAEGDAAVEPLLDDLVHDTRLTRSVHFFRDFHRSRTIMGAHEAAYTALCGILRTSFFGAASTGDNLTARGLDGRLKVAESIRAYWEKNRGVPLVERWYRTLADDVAGPTQWLQAAGNIVQHENISVVPGSTVFKETVTTASAPGAPPRLRGESLRANHDPSVSELMIQRIGEIDPGQPIENNSPHQLSVRSANDLAVMLAEWDIKAALPVLKARMTRAIKIDQDGPENQSRVFGIRPTIARLTKLRLQAGDSEALNDYASWVRTLTPSRVETFEMDVFEPMLSHPEHPAIVAAAAALFEDPKSPWNPSIRPESLSNQPGIWQFSLRGPLLSLRPYRTLVIRALADKTQVGTVETDTNGNIITIEGATRVIEGPNARSYSSVELGGAGGEVKPYKPGASAMPLRVSDIVCEYLQALPGIPRFQKQWPVAKRDAALTACIAYLKQYGERFGKTGRARAVRQPTDAGMSFLSFDALDHPATPADVAAGRAIFSLSHDGREVRVVQLPSYPLEARWTKLEVFRDDPPIVRVYDRKGHEKPNTEALQTGLVWQAEEVREGNTWRRFYGFVGRHALTRVPAEEIELPGSWQDGWQTVSHELDARIELKQAATSGPIPFEVSFRNHHGVEISAPADFVRNIGGMLTIREGITFRLIREWDDPTPPNPFADLEGAPKKVFPPEQIAPLPVGRYQRGASTQRIAPAESARAFGFDLRSLFAITQPGRYLLEITFDDLRNDEGEPGKAFVEFPVIVGKSE